MRFKLSYIFSVVVLLCVAWHLSAQTVSNVSAEQVGKNILISYQLDKLADITIQYSTDGGSTYHSMSHTSGDVGNDIDAGQHSITWDVLADVEKMVCSNLVFKVTPGGGEKLTFVINGVSFNMLRVDGGTYIMGATREQGSDAKSDEKPTHSVTLSTYYMGETEVTQALWQAVMETNPSYFAKGGNYPVETVSWDDCETFVSKLNSLLSSQLGGRLFSLPTEAQWEYAARGGKKSQGYKYSGGNFLLAEAWYEENSGGTTHPVRIKKANELGLCDMNGNVWEWCLDWYGNYSSNAQTNPQGPASGSLRVCRGGSWTLNAGYCRVSCRSYDTPSDRFSGLGLRLCLLP